MCTDTSGGKLTQFAGGAQTFGLACLADGRVYFTDSATPAIGRIDPDGGQTRFDIPTPAEHIFGIAIGADGQIWVTEWSNDSSSAPGAQLISRIASDGSKYDVVPISGYGIPREVALGPDGAVWFTIGSSLAKLDPERGSCEFLSPPWQTPWITVEVGALTISADGTVWIGSISGASGHIGGYSPTSRAWIVHEIPGGFPNQLAVEDNGVLWYTDFHHAQAGRIDPEGRLTRVDIPGQPFGITASRDEIWITEFAASRATKLDRDTAQPIETLPLPIGSQPQAVGVDRPVSCG